MKIQNILSIVAISLFIVCLSSLVGLFYTTRFSVGDIKYKKEIDNKEFELRSKHIYQYYSSNASSIEERNILRNKLLLEIGPITFTEKRDGYITIRFIINHKGETDRFRVFQIDDEMKETRFDQRNINKILSALKGVKAWKAGEIAVGDKIDSYYQLNFKIEKGKIIDIF